MLRAIEAFHRDEHGDWVATLACGHRQHVRHDPPFWSCPWVTTEEGRAEKLGSPLPCVLCDRFELPAGYAPYKRTKDFTTQTVPAALLQHHSTKAGVWGVIHVLEGRLRYVVEAPLARDEVIEAGGRGVIVAEVVHRVEPQGEVRFFVEFHGRAATP